MNLFTGRNLNNDECIFDVHSFATELDEDTLRTEINGGGCGGDAIDSYAWNYFSSLKYIFSPR